MTIRELQRINVLRNPVAFPECKDWKLVDWTNALAGEVGEACNRAKKFKRDGYSQIAVQEFMKELADVIMYATLAANCVKADLEQACICKFNEVSERRGYKIRILDGKSTK